MMNSNEIVGPIPENNRLKLWIKALGGPKRVGAMLGYDSSNLWRYCAGKLPTPMIIEKFMDLSEKNARQRQRICQQKRKITQLKNQLKRES